MLLLQPPLDLEAASLVDVDCSLVVGENLEKDLLQSLLSGYVDHVLSQLSPKSFILIVVMDGYPKFSQMLMRDGSICISLLT